jgi:hypothetical protein
MTDEEAAAFTLDQHNIARRARWMWRGAGIVSAVVLVVGFGWWGVAIGAFAWFQFLAYATSWHTYRDVQRATGLQEMEQDEIVRTGKPLGPDIFSVREQMLAIRPLNPDAPFISSDASKER